MSMPSLSGPSPMRPLARSPVAHAPMNTGGKARSPAKAIVAGSISGAVEAVISYPTEFVKTQMQLFEERARQGPVAVARATVARDGPLGLYRGLSALLFFSVPKVATRFLAYEQLKGALTGSDGRLSTSATLLCGLGAGAAEAVVAVTPMDTIKTRLIHDQLTRAPHERQFRGLLHGVTTIVRADGLAGVYKGLAATVLKQGSNQAIRWLVFTRAKEAMAGGVDTRSLGVGHTIVASVAAGAASVYGNTPIDVIKTRMQGLTSNRYSGVIDCARQIAAKEGVRGFYKGATARLARVCLDVTLIMVMYEQLSKVLDAVWKD